MQLLPNSSSTAQEVVAIMGPPDNMVPTAVDSSSGHNSIDPQIDKTEIHHIFCK